MGGQCRDRPRGLGGPPHPDDHEPLRRRALGGSSDRPHRRNHGRPTASSAWSSLVQLGENRSHPHGRGHGGTGGMAESARHHGRGGHARISPCTRNAREGRARRSQREGGAKVDANFIARNPRSRWVDRWRASRPTPPCTGFMARRCPHGTSCPSMASRTLTEPNRTGVSTTERLPVLVPRRESRNGPALRRSLSLAGSSQPVKVLPPTPDELALR